jgi:hypothetical protein
MNGGEDQDFERRIGDKPRIRRYWKATTLPLARIYLINRRNHGHYHTSGCWSLGEINPEVHKGKYRLQPHWKKDYCRQVKRKIERLLLEKQT